MDINRQQSVGLISIRPFKDIPTDNSVGIFDLNIK